jgi:hypothetical protein
MDGYMKKKIEMFSSRRLAGSFFAFWAAAHAQKIGMRARAFTHARAEAVVLNQNRHQFAELGLARRSASRNARCAFHGAFRG